MNQLLRNGIYALLFCAVIALSALVLSAMPEFQMKSGYPVNENGQTYGPVTLDDQSKTIRPDLILAQGVDGTDGYILETDFDDCSPLEKPQNPEEAMDYMRQLEILREDAFVRGDPYLYYLPLYDSDGTTLLGLYGVGSTHVTGITASDS